MNITIDPDDTELKDAINLVEARKKRYENADKARSRAEPAGYIYGQQFNAWDKARKEYESALVNLALIFMERL